MLSAATVIIRHERPKHLATPPVLATQNFKNLLLQCQE